MSEAFGTMGNTGGDSWGGSGDDGGGSKPEADAAWGGSGDNTGVATGEQQDSTKTNDPWGSGGDDGGFGGLGAPSEDVFGGGSTGW